MYGDTEVMRRYVARLREQATTIRAIADRVVHQAETVSWPGRAGDTMRERVRDRAAHLREAAQQHETAADSLDAHLHLVDELKDSIADVERRAGALVDDGALGRFEPPAPGHKDWLAVTLPGVDDRGPDGRGQDATGHQDGGAGRDHDRDHHRTAP